MQLPNSGLTGTFGAGACGEFRALGAPGGNTTNTATAGGTTTKIMTTLNITRNLKGCRIRVVAGSGVGYDGTIDSVRLGTNSEIAVTPASSVAFDNTTQYQIFSGSLWAFIPGAGTIGFGVYDRATNAWTARSTAGVATFGTVGQLVSTGGAVSNSGAGFLTGAASSGASTTLTDSTKTLVTDAWKNYQIRITGGTGKGQIRAISSNTATAYTVSSAWTVIPDATSQYIIEGNDDYMYLLGNASVTLYRFSISANTWSTLSPSVARAGSAAAGCTCDWIDSVPDASWSNGLSESFHATGLVKQNGRYLLSFRGGATAMLDAYDIASNTWINALTYGQQQETFSTGSCSVDMDGIIYLQRDATGRIYRFDVAKWVLEPFTLNPVPQGAAVDGDKMFMTSYNDGGDDIKYLYSLGNTRSELTRWIVI